LSIAIEQQVNAGAEDVVSERTADGNVGARIRELRAQRGLSVTELGRQTGVTKGQISQIERGTSNASIPVLRAISKALGVPLFTLFVDDDPHDALVRRHERRQLRVPGSKIVRELLVPDLHRRIVLISATFAPGDSSADEPASHSGEECVVVLKGTMQIEINGRPVNLGEGDSYYFDSAVPHIFRNVSDEPAEIMAAISSRNGR
jgi:transcriptional regulator with XRE-family HTH domain